MKKQSDIFCISMKVITIHFLLYIDNYQATQTK